MTGIRETINESIRLATPTYLKPFVHSMETVLASTTLTKELANKPDANQRISADLKHTSADLEPTRVVLDPTGASLNPMGPVENCRRDTGRQWNVHKVLFIGRSTRIQKDQAIIQQPCNEKEPRRLIVAFGATV